MQLNDKTVIVTGAARGLGLAIARRLTQDGARVALVDVDAHRLEQAREPVAAFFGVKPSEIAFTRNATEGNATIASGLDLRPGDEVIFESHAHPGGAMAWMSPQKEQGIKVDKTKIPWAASGRALSLGRAEGFTKLLWDKETERVIGGAVVGPNAGDLIAEVGLAIEMGADAADIGMTIHPHPTLSETVAFAAEAYEGTLTDLYMPKRR